MRNNSFLRLISMLSCVVLLGAAPAFASEVTGTFGTGTGISGTVKSAPAASVASGTYHSSQSVTLSATSASSVRYTIDGSTPSCPGTGTLYTSAITVNAGETLKAVACYGDGSSSTVSSLAYVFQCSTDSVSNGSVSSYPSCSITCNSGYSLSGG